MLPSPGLARRQLQNSPSERRRRGAWEKGHFQLNSNGPPALAMCSTPVYCEECGGHGPQVAAEARQKNVR